MTPVLLPIFLYAASAPATAELPPPVELVPFRCGAIADTDVRPVLAVEIRGRLLDEPGPIPSAAVAVSVSCRGSDVVLGAATPGQVGPPLRLVALAGLAENARPRAVALAIAELVRPPSSPALSAPARVETAAVSETAAAVPFDTENSRHWEILGGAAGGGYTSQPSHTFEGAHLRATYFWLRARQPRLASWWFGPALDLNFMGTSFWNGDAGLHVTSVGLGFTAERPFGVFTPQVTVGDRFGWSTFNDDRLALDASAETGGAFLELGVKVGVGLLQVRLAVEGGLPMTSPGTFCSGASCIDFSGPWLTATADAAVTF